MVRFSATYGEEVSIVFCGEAGHGVRTLEQMIFRVMKLSGYNVFSSKEYMSRIRGGSNSVQVRVSSGRVSAPVNRIDLLFPLDNDAMKHMEKRISGNTIILGEKKSIGDGRNVMDVPFSSIASGSGSNMAAVGVVCGIFGIERRITEACLNHVFSGKGKDIKKRNMEVLGKGYDIGRKLSETGRISVSIRKDPKAKNSLMLYGMEALSLGVIAGGCDFISAYPMSPSTGLLTFLSKHAKDFGIVAEQAEDEISAINMSVGAWYAGARAIASTSGGGFALMEEGVSLSGMLETPVVIHIAQRPGPATGLPTRTEQGDLELALYSGHGEFPRIILAPGNAEELFSLAHRAFDLADRFQVPVFILTDQAMLDSLNVVPSIVPPGKPKKHIVRTGKGYRRYELTANGISPRGIPGFGKGLVCVDSDEHDEEGHITEDFDVRTDMVDKRLRKLDLIKKEIVKPRLVGKKNYINLMVCWGSTLSAAKEALEKLGRDDTAMLHFSQVYPLHPSLSGHLKKAKKTIIVENNATSQFGKLIKLATGTDVDHMILKYNGLAFSSDELAERIGKILGR